MQIHWNILIKETSQGKMVDIELVPEDQNVRYFLSEINTYRFPIFLNGVNKSSGFHNEMSHLTFFNDLDAEDFSIGNIFEQNYIRISHNMYSTSIIEEVKFSEMAYQYGQAVFETHRDSVDVQKHWEWYLSNHIQRNSWNRDYYLNFDQNWNNAMQENLIQLLQKMKNYL